MGEQQHLQTENDEIFKTFTAAIKTAAEMTHCYNLFQSKNKKIDEVLCLDNKEILWQTLQEYLQEYGSFINNSGVIDKRSVFFEIVLQCLPKDFLVIHA